MTYDCLVLGIGSMGASACYHLASRGQRVLGIEQFDIVHTNGSHGGQSRIIRKAYFEHADYIPLLQRAYDNWAVIESLSGGRIYHRTGLFYAAPNGHALLQQVMQSALLYDIPLEKLSHEQAANRFPQFHLPAAYEVVFEPDAGFLLPDVAIRAYTHAAQSCGAILHAGEKVLGWTADPNGVTVVTDKATYHAGKLLITAGPWAAQLIPGIGRHLQVTRQVLAWYQPGQPGLFTRHRFPCWLIAEEDSPGAFYGFPMMDPDADGISGGIKLALHYPGQPASPDAVDRVVTDTDLGPLKSFAEKFIPMGNGRLIDAQTCLYSNTPDEHFVIDLLPGHHDRVAMAWGFSGHGFKFASAVGEVLADLAIQGHTEWPIGFLNSSRFS